MIEPAAHVPVRSAVPGLAWPGLPAPEGQALLAAQFQFDRTQWWPAEKLKAAQFAQLRRLVAHAVDHVPHYRDGLAKLGLAGAAALTPEIYSRWPVLDKRAVQADAARFEADALPAGHGEMRLITTSGSSGEPLRAATTDAAIAVQNALVLRSLLWYRFDFSRRYDMIRMYGGTGEYVDWGPPAALAFRTGTTAQLPATEDYRRQLEWLCGRAPAYLLINGFNLNALLAESQACGLVPAGLRAVITMGEVLPAGTAALARRLWQAEVHDVYSACEVGPIAFQCPDGPGLHVQGEHVYVEVLRDDGSQCMPGESGRVVVTDLHNFAMPLLRYELRDFATVGSPCACGRGLPVIGEVLGRTGQVAVDPTGRRFFGRVNRGFWSALSPVTQRQVVQVAPGRMEVRYVAPRALTAEEMSALTRELCAALGYAYAVGFTRMDSIARNAGGKFDEFLSLIEPEAEPDDPPAH
ncbi:MAG: phenylacetate--CoA ligase family protein [Burkholderiales bacterium]|nr:phenylacetate--CoA ligase family protein [Burkholderiales bacterium]